MTRLAQKKLVFARADDAAAFSAADALVVSNAELTPIAGDQVSRELEQNHFGSQPEHLVNAHQMLKFGVEFAAVGDADTAQKWALLLKATGFAETLTAAANGEPASAVYKPVTSSPAKCKLAFQQDKKFHTLPGCLGTVSVELAANAIPRFAFEMTGKWQAPADKVNPLGGTFAGWPDPQIVSKANTPTVSIFGQSDLPFMKASINIANTVVHRSLANADPGVIITDRAPTAELTIDATDWDPFAKALDLAGTGEGAVTITHGKAGGRQIEIAMPRVRINATGLTYTEDNGVLQYTIPLQVLPDDGNDELTFTVT